MRSAPASRADHGTEADEAAPEHGDGRSRLDARGEERSADAGRESAREGRAPVERRLAVDDRERDLRQHRVVGERRRAHEVTQRLAVSRETSRPVGEVPGVLLVADRDAAVGLRAAAVHALAALRCEQRHDVIAGPDGADTVADALDDARTLVPEHAGRVARRVDAGRGVHVGVADAARGEPHEDLTGLRLGEVDLLDDERLTELLEDGRSDLHGENLPRRARIG
jgi:hypothetical protein